MLAWLMASSSCSMSMASYSVSPTTAGSPTGELPYIQADSSGPDPICSFAAAVVPGGEVTARNRAAHRCGRWSSAPASDHVRGLLGLSAQRQLCHGLWLGNGPAYRRRIGTGKDVPIRREDVADSDRSPAGGWQIRADRHLHASLQRDGGLPATGRSEVADGKPRRCRSCRLLSRSRSLLS